MSIRCSVCLSVCLSLFVNVYIRVLLRWTLCDDCIIEEGMLSRAQKHHHHLSRPRHFDFLSSARVTRRRRGNGSSRRTRVPSVEGEALLVVVVFIHWKIPQRIP